VAMAPPPPPPEPMLLDDFMAIYSRYT
jgi:hypothetical protein